MAQWNHAICERDWINRRATWTPLPKGGEALESVPQPVRLKEPSLELCCFCGEPTIFGVYLRHDPNDTELACHGRDDWHSE